VLRALLRRLSGVTDTEETLSPRRPDVDDSGRTWQERCDLLQGQINRLRGAVTGAIRHNGASAGSQDDPGSTNGPPPGAGVSPATWARLDAAARERLVARRPRAIPHGSG